MRSAVVDAYFDWLLEMVGYYEGDGHDNLMWLLFNTDFTWSVANDDNRAAEGIELRRIFMEKEGWFSEPLDGEECCCLEMFIGLAKRMDDDIMWDGETDRTADWFWMMMANMGFDEHDDYYVIEDVLERFLDRKYALNGDGGPFPLKGRNVPNQRKIEIWRQMQAYMVENYEF